MATKDVNHIEVIDDITQQMNDLLKEQFKNKDSIKKLQEVISEVKKSMQVTAVAMAEARLLDVATGVTLDDIGEFVGVPRKAESDEEYRVALKIRILRLRTHGTRSEIVNIVSQTSGIPPEEIRVYSGLFKTVDIGIYQTCLDYENGAKELANMLPINSNFRLINLASGNIFSYGSVHLPAPSNVKGYGSMHFVEDGDVSGRYSSLMSRNEL